MFPAITGLRPGNFDRNHTGGFDFLEIGNKGVVTSNEERINFTVGISINFEHFRVLKILLFHTKKHDSRLRIIHTKTSQKIIPRERKGWQPKSHQNILFILFHFLIVKETWRRDGHVQKKQSTEKKQNVFFGVFSFTSLLHRVTLKYLTNYDLSRSKE